MFFLSLLVALSGCQELGSESPRQPPRAIAGGRSTAVPVNSTTNEVGAAGQVRVRVADRAGAGIQGVTPTITLVTTPNGTTVVSGASGSCGSTNFNGETTCTVSAGVPGTHYLRVLSPASFYGASMGFIQIARSLRFSTQPVCTGSGCTARANFNTQPAVEILDGAGNRITTGSDASRPISLSVSGSPSGVLFGASGSYPGAISGSATTSTTAAAGVATFSLLNLNKSGTYSLVATATSALSGASVTSSASSAITIVPGAFAGLEFTSDGQPGNTSANLALSPQPKIRLYDANGNTVTNLNCVATISGNNLPGGATLLGTLSKSFQSGVVDFSGNNLRVQTTTASSAPHPNLVATLSGPTGCSGSASSNTFTIDLSGLPSQLAVLQAPSSAALSEIWPTQPKIQVLDINGSLVSTDNNTIVTITKSGGSPAGPLSGGTSVQVVNGIANFAGLLINSTTTGHAGAYTYTASGVSPGLTISSVSFGQNITSNGLVTPFRMFFSVQPTNSSINQGVGTIELKKLDANGFLNFTENSQQVDVIKASGPGTMTSVTPVTLVNGVATIPGPSFNSAGTYTLWGRNITDFSVTSEESNAFSVASFGAPNKLAFSTEPNAGASQGQTAWATQPVIDIQDVAGNRVMNASSQITLNCVQWGGGSACTLLGGSTVTAINGRATFAGLRTSQAGLVSLVLEATSSAINGVTPLSTQSSSFNGNPGVPTQLRFAKMPVAIYSTGGSYYVSSINPGMDSISVEILDNLGNIVNTSSGTVTLTITSGGSAPTHCVSAGVGNTATPSGGLATFPTFQTTSDGFTNGCRIQATLSSPVISVQSNTFLP